MTERPNPKIGVEKALDALLLAGVKKRSPGLVAKALGAGASPLAASQGKGALSLAIEAGQAEVIVALAKAGGALGVCELDGQGCPSLLFQALVGDSPEALEAMLGAGADVHADLDKDGSTMAMIVCFMGKPACLPVLIAHGVDARATCEGDQAAHVAAPGGQGSAGQGSGYAECLRLLLEEGVDVDVRNASRETPLMLAASRGNLEVVNFLLGRGADVEAVDRQGRRARDFAALRCQSPSFLWGDPGACLASLERASLLADGASAAAPSVAAPRL